MIYGIIVGIEITSMRIVGEVMIGAGMSTRLLPVEKNSLVQVSLMSHDLHDTLSISPRTAVAGLEWSVVVI